MRTSTLTPRTVSTLALTHLILLVVLLSEKPMATKVNFSMNPEDTEKEMFELKQKLGALTAVPKKKYPFPMTSS